MIAIIAAKDLREFIRDGRLFWAGTLVVLLMLTAVGVGWQRQVQIQSERAAGQALDYDAWLSQGLRHPHDAAEQGMHVFKPEPPLAILDPGIEPYVGSTVWLQAHRQSEVKFRPAQDATGLQRFGDLSPAWVLQILMPLVIIIVGFNAMSGERESGTLRQLLSLGVPPRTLLLGKALALASCSGMLILPAGLLATGFALLSGEGIIERSGLVWRLLWFAASYGLYLGLFVFLVLAVSTLAKSSRGALVVLLGFWIAGSLVAPRAAAELATMLYPTPSRLEFDEHLTREMAEAARKAWLENFGVATQWDSSVPLSKWGRALQVDDEAGYGALDRNFGILWDAFEAQQRAQQWIGLIAPVIAVRDFSMGIAGTDFAQHRDFSLAAEAQRRLIQNIVSEDLIEHADSRAEEHFSYKAGPELWARVPRFDYRLPSVSFALSRHYLSLAILAVGFFLSATLAWFAFSFRLVD